MINQSPKGGTEIQLEYLEKYVNKGQVGVDNPQAFIKRIARNRFFDLQRRKKIIQFDVLEDTEVSRHEILNQFGSAILTLVEELTDKAKPTVQEEALNALTINAAYAMGISESHGSITIGKKANLLITKEIPNLAYIPYAFGDNHIEQTIGF